MKGNLQQNAVLFLLVSPFDDFSPKNITGTAVSIGLTKRK
jgi:hypothetical protein